VCIAARTSNDDITSRRYAKVEGFNGDYFAICSGLLLVKILKFEFTLKYAEAVDIRIY